MKTTDSVTTPSQKVTSKKPSEQTGWIMEGTLLTTLPSTRGRITGIKIGEGRGYSSSIWTGYAIGLGLGLSIED